MRRLLAILLVFLAVGCQKEVSFVGGPDPIPNVPAPITSDLQGNVFDENGQPASGVSIKVGSQTTTTDTKGYFRIRSASLDKLASLVSAEKSGYFKTYKTFSATAAVNHVEIKLIKKSLTGAIDATTGGEVSLSNGSKVKLNPNSIVTASNGTPFAGQVQVYAAYIDPTTPDIVRTVPGSFMADDKNGRRVLLESYGMMAVELESAAGEKLQIKTGSTATLTTAIPSSLTASAPATIATWSVNETTGIWKEETTATKSGSVYVGEVSHFSFWNCDINVPAVQLTVQIKDQAGLPIVQALVRIYRNTMSSAGGWTDSLGMVSGLVPANESLVLKVMDLCDNPIFSQNIGPFSANTNLGAITLNPSVANAITTVKGKLLNCSGNPVTSGFAIINYGNTTRYAAVDNAGNFQKNLLTCSSAPNTISVIGVDSLNGQQNTTAVTATIAYPITNFNSITACGTSTLEFLNYTLDGTSFALSSTNAADSLAAYPGGGTTNGFAMMGFNSGPPVKNFYLTANSTAAGTYPIQNASINQYQQGNTLINPSTITFTNYASVVGQFYEGSFTGSFTNASVTHTFSGTFRLRRNF